MRPYVISLLLLAGCGSSSSAPPASAPTTVASAPPVASVPAELPPAAKAPEGPAVAIANLAVSVKKQGEQRTLELSWEVTRHRELPPTPPTVLFVHSTCKVGYGNKYEDSSVGGVEAIPTDTARPFKTSAFAVAPLPFDPAHCTFAFAFGPKGSKDETKLGSFCWKNGAVKEGDC